MRHAFSLAVLLAAAPAGAIQLGVDQTFGPTEYKQTSFQAQFGGDRLSLSPQFSLHEAKATGSFKTLSARLGFDFPMVGVGFNAGTTFKESRYSSLFGGAEIALTLSAGGGKAGRRRIGGAGRSGAPAGKGLGRIDLGAGGLLTRHKLDAAGTSPGGELDQRDVYGFVGAAILGAHLSGRLTSSSYSKTINPAAGLPTTTNTSPRVAIEGHLGVLNGYPKSSLHLRGELPVFPMVLPWASYTKTSYEAVAAVQPPDTSALAVGASIGLEMLEVSAAFQRVAVSNAGDNTFVSLGAGLRF